MWGTVLGKGQAAEPSSTSCALGWGEREQTLLEREMRNSWPCPWHKAAKQTPRPLSHLRVPAPCLKHELQRGLSCLGQDSSLFCCFQTCLWSSASWGAPWHHLPEKRGGCWAQRLLSFCLPGPWTCHPSFGSGTHGGAYLTCVGWINTHVNIESYRAGISKTFLKRTRY